ncbi:MULTISPECIES: pentapeptide repeat-containing protein [unclassified Anabaena]|uniref:pentapeptide repeat-containing protein n=1 Tax=unclassified Anabaena TaxID=2619674 RepID=UPI002B20D640|nr:pentapeptide repeat-containing protein [Anabaena sp. UHCC 0399]MEA5565710.1 pentapeptide repeat-containing protein [Anabaena sp. UHCC 0399]
MFNVITNFYNATTKQIINSHFSLTNILHNIHSHADKPEKISPHVVRQKCNLLIEYWQQQKPKELVAQVSQLETLAQNYPQYYGMIIEFLSDFVRNHTPYISQEGVNSSPKLTIGAEIQAVVTVIARINRKKDSENTQLDLSHTDLRWANLKQANLEWTNLYHVNLAGANLSQANLSGAILSAANLCGANLSGANLSGAILSAANLSQANLTGANLSQANLYLANLHQASLDDVIFNGANLREAKFAKTDQA